MAYGISLLCPKSLSGVFYYVRYYNKYQTNYIQNLNANFITLFIHLDHKYLLSVLDSKLIFSLLFR